MGIKGKIQKIKEKNKPLGILLQGLISPYILIAIIFIIWMLFFDANSWLIHRELDGEIDKLQGNMEFFDRETSGDKEQIKKLKDSVELERFARETYLMKREDEEIYIIEFEDSIKTNEEE